MVTHHLTLPQGLAEEVSLYVNRLACFMIHILTYHCYRLFVSVLCTVLVSGVCRGCGGGVVGVWWGCAGGVVGYTSCRLSGVYMCLRCTLPKFYRHTYLGNGTLQPIRMCAYGSLEVEL